MTFMIRGVFLKVMSVPLEIPNWVSKLFLAIDARDADVFVSFLARVS